MTCHVHFTAALNTGQSRTHRCQFQEVRRSSNHQRISNKTSPFFKSEASSGDRFGADCVCGRAGTSRVDWWESVSLRRGALISADKIRHFRNDLRRWRSRGAGWVNEID